MHRTLLLKRQDIVGLLSFDEYVNAIEAAFRLQGHGLAIRPELMHVNSLEGEFHIKAGGLSLDRPYFAVKANAGFFQNMQRFGMPAIQGVIILYDGENGYPLAIMDSKEITVQRTGAATAVAAKYLARKDSKTVTICGCGTQGRIQLRAIAAVIPIEQAFSFSIDHFEACEYAAEMSLALNIPVEVAKNLHDAVAASDVCVTCTPSRQYFLKQQYVSPGTFISAIGADSPEKQEIDPGLLSSSKVVVDILAQCAKVGELHHALVSGMPLDRVHAELGEVVAGIKPGRESAKEIIVFDATGTALQDVAAAAAIYEKARTQGLGIEMNLFGDGSNRKF